MGVPLAAQAKPCIAYVRNGELRALCSGRDQLLLRKRGLASFAIGVHGGTVLGGEGWAYFVKHGIWTQLNLPPKTSAFHLYGSCGIALAPQGSIGFAERPTVDIITGRRPSFTSLKWPHCSANRSLVVGLNEKMELVTNRGRAVPRWPAEYDFYSGVSPSGQWVAYIDGSATSGIPVDLCLLDTLDWSSRCYGKDAKGRSDGFDQGAIGNVSVNNLGEVLLSQGTSATCWSSEGGAFSSTQKFAGGARGQCFGVGIASPKLAPRVIIPLGFRPTWVSKGLLQMQFGAFKSAPKHAESRGAGITSAGAIGQR